MTKEYKLSTKCWFRKIKWLGPTIRLSRKKSFEVGDLVWKIILPVGSKDRELGKWSPNWEGPFKVHQVLHGNAYWLVNLQGEPHKRFINKNYLKKYFLTMWEILKTSQKELGRFHFKGTMLGKCYFICFEVK